LNSGPRGALVRNVHALKVDGGPGARHKPVSNNTASRYGGSAQLPRWFANSMDVQGGPKGRQNTA